MLLKPKWIKWVIIYTVKNVKDHMNPTEKTDTYIKETVKKAVDQVNSTEKKDT